MPSLDRVLNGPIISQEWRDRNPTLSGVLDMLGEMSGVYPSQRVWKTVGDVWRGYTNPQPRKPGMLKEQLPQIVDKGAATLTDVFAMMPSLDQSDLMKMAPMVAGLYRRAKPEEIKAGSNAFSALWDRVPRIEIDDSKAYLKNLTMDPRGTGDMRSKANAKLGDVLEHPELYKSNPEMKNYPVDIKVGKGFPREGGFYQDKFIDVSGPDLDSALGTTIHEAGHGLQGIGGMAKGGSPTMSALNFGVRTTPVQDAYSAAKGFHIIAKRKGWGIDKAEDFFLKEGYHPEVSNLAQKILATDSKERIIAKANEMQKRAAYDSYRNLAGEFEARDAASRIDLTPEQRITTPSYSSEPDIKLSDLIVRKGGDEAATSINSMDPLELAKQYGIRFDGTPDYPYIGKHYQFTTPYNATITIKNLDELPAALVAKKKQFMDAGNKVD